MNSSKKRMAKAIERTLRWFDEQIISVKGVNRDNEIRSSADGRGDSSNNSDNKDNSGNIDNKDNRSSDADRSCSNANTNSIEIGIDGEVAFFGVAQYNPNYPVQIEAIVRNIILKGAAGDGCYTAMRYVICDTLFY